MQPPQNKSTNMCDTESVNKKPRQHPYFFVISNAGSLEVNGVYKNLDKKSNDGTLNYKMINSEGRAFKLYRTPSEDRTLRYWMIEERSKEYFYMVVDDGDNPPEFGWKPYIAGKPTPPMVTRIPTEVELELRKRIELGDSLTTLDLATEYGEYCPLEALKRLYRVLWKESLQAHEAVREAMAKRRKKSKVKPKIVLIINLGGCVPDESQSFELTITFDAIVYFLKKEIAKRLDLWSGSCVELLQNRIRILSNRASIDKLGIRMGSSLFVLSKNKFGSGLSQISLPETLRETSPETTPSTTCSTGYVWHAEAKHGGRHRCCIS